MTCTGCGREVTLMDGHYCGLCLAEIAEAVGDAIADLDVLEGDIHDIVTYDDGYLHVRIDDGSEGSDRERPDIETMVSGMDLSDGPEPRTDGGQVADADLAIRPGQTWTMDESRADPDDVAEPHDVELWATRPKFHAVVDGVLDGLVELTVATGNDHPRTPDLGATVDIAANRLREDPRWRVRR